MNDTLLQVVRDVVGVGVIGALGIGMTGAAWALAVGAVLCWVAIFLSRLKGRHADR